MRPRSTVKTLALLGILTTVSACVNTAVTRIGTLMARPEVPMDQVTIYTTAAKVPRKYEEIALLNSAGMTGWTNEEQMFKNMRYQAGKAGANAIILDAISEPSAVAKVAAAVLGVGAERKGKAVAIFVFPEEKKQ